MSVLRWQQKDGLDTALPYGLRRIQALRTLTTESTAVLIPSGRRKSSRTAASTMGRTLSVKT